MNTRQIQSKLVWYQNGEKTATILALAEFYGYHFDDGGGKVQYKLIGMEPVITNDSDGNPISTPVAVDYFTGVVDIPSNIVQQWGASDNIVWDYVADQLNIQFI